MTSKETCEAIVVALTEYVDTYGPITTEEDIALAALAIYNALMIDIDDEDEL